VTVEIADPRLGALIDPEAGPVLLGSGFAFVEGPVWNPREACLYFSDIKADTRRRWSEQDGATAARHPNSKGNGMTYDADLGLLVCEHATSQVTRHHGGTVEVVASHYQGHELNSPNDIVVSRSGSVYFTDPAFGRTREDLGILREQELSFQGLFRVTPGGQLELLDDDYDQPNGLCFAPDESALYVNDCRRNTILQYEVRADGSLGARSVLVEGIPGFDGMKCDEAGNIYITGPDTDDTGILVFDDAGTRLGMLGLPEKPTNLNWGGPGWSDLYITARTSLFRYSLKVAGARCSYMNSPVVPA
jgi:gluconolactonase